MNVFFSEQITVQSSAQRITLDLQEFGKSLIYAKKKKKWPKNAPPGLTTYD